MPAFVFLSNAILAVLAAVPGAAGGGVPGGTERDLLPAARTVALDNGFRAVLIENRDAPVVASVVTVRAGAVHEAEGQGGSAHMLEHFLFNGTAGRSREEIERVSELHGIYNNAHTGLEATSYMVLAHRDHTRVALELQADMLLHSTLPEGQMEKEKGVVLNEIARGVAGTETGALEAACAALLEGTPYHRDPLGTPESVKALTRDALLAFYRARYVPNAMTAVVMGDFEMSEMESILRGLYGTVPVGPPTPPSGFGSSSSLLGRRITRETPGATAQVALVATAPTWGEPGYAAMRLLADRLPPALERALTTPGGGMPHVESVYEAHADVAVFGVALSAQPGEATDSLERRLRTALADLNLEGFPADSIDLGRTRLVAEEVYLSEKPHYFGMLNGTQIAVAGWDAYREGLEGMWSLDPEGLRRQLAQVLSPSRSVTVVAAPHPTAGLSPPAVAAPPSTVVEAGVVTRSPPGGPLVRVMRSPASRVFGLHVLVRGRQTEEPAGEGGLADLLHRCLALGSRGQDRAGLENALARQGARLKVADDPAIPYDDPYTARDFSFLRFETLDRYALAQGIPLLVALLRDPALEEGAVAREREDAIRRLEGSRRNARDRGRALLDVALFGTGSPYARPIPGTAESLAAITPQDLRRFTRDYLAPDRLIVTVVTSLDADRVADDLARGLARRTDDLGRAPVPPSAGPPLPQARREDAAQVAASPAQRLVREHLGGDQAVVLRGRLLPVPEGERRAAQTAVYLLADRMSEEIREQRGLAYALGASLTPIGEGAPLWLLEVRVETTPRQVNETREALRGTLERAAGYLPTPSDLERVWNRVAGQELMRRLSRVNLAYSQGVALFHGLDPEEMPGTGVPWRALTPEQIRQASTGILSLDRMVEVVVD